MRAIAVFSTAVLGPAVVVGAAAALHHKNLGLSDADKGRLTLELNAGKAAVGVMSKPETESAISEFLTRQVAHPKNHELTDEAVQAAETTDNSGKLISRC